MKIVNSVKKIQDIIKNIDKTIGFVPTMGALHDGHISLIKKAKEQNEVVIVSIFVNPTQFNDISDLQKYPRKDVADIKICEFLDIDYLFMPHKDDIYFGNDIEILPHFISSYKLEGAFRPKHFSGVLQIVLKLFNLINPTNAYFGKKDVQQLLLIESMVEQLFLDINIIRCETLRDKDGLAYSSRNIFLTNNQKKEALMLPQTLLAMVRDITQSNLKTDEIIKKAIDSLKNKFIKIEYIDIIDTDIKRANRPYKKDTIVLGAIKVGAIRIIDNIWI